MRQLRLGSYSTAATLAGTPSFTRLKSMMRYWRLWPPPRWRDVMRPWALRPAFCGFGATSVRSGVVLVTSEKSETVWNRRPALVGLRLRRGMRGPASVLEQRDLGTRFEGDEGSLGVRAAADLVALPVALGLADAVEGVHLDDLHAPDRLDGVVDLGLAGALVDMERVDALLDEGVALLRHDRSDHDVAGILHHCSSVSVSAAAASAVSASASSCCWLFGS